MQTQLLIGGRLVAGEGPAEQVLDAATGLSIAAVAAASTAQVDAAVAAAEQAFESWAHTSPKERAALLLKIADRIESQSQSYAALESHNTGKPLQAMLNDEIPAIADVFRFFAGAARTQHGPVAGEYLPGHTSLVRRDPIGVVASIAPWNYPLMMAAWKIAPAIAAGNTTVVKPASPTPWSLLKLAELLEGIVPAGVINIVNGPGAEVGMALASSKRIAKVAFTGETATGRLIMGYAAQNIIPSTTELGGKSPNIFFDDVMAADDDFLDKAIEGLVLYAFNKGEVCTCPSRALIQESMYDRFMARCLERIAAIKQGHPLDINTQIGAQVSAAQLEKITRYVKIGRDEGAELLIGGQRNVLAGDLAEGYYFQPTVFHGTNNMRIFQEEIFGPVLAVTTFKDEAEALEIANDTPYGLGAGVWTRDGTLAYRMGRGIKAGRVWTNCYHLYPAGAAFGGYKNSGVGRENHKMMLDHYTQTKNLLVSYSPKPLGFF
jgi:aldehyde dehydrogenase